MWLFIDNESVCWWWSPRRHRRLCQVHLQSWCNWNSVDSHLPTNKRRDPFKSNTSDFHTKVRCWEALLHTGDVWSLFKGFVLDYCSSHRRTMGGSKTCESENLTLCALWVFFLPSRNTCGIFETCYMHIQPLFTPGVLDSAARSPWQRQERLRCRAWARTYSYSQNNFCASWQHKSCRSVSTFCKVYVCACRHGLARSGTEYGPLTDLPDWSFAGIVYLPSIRFFY